MFTSQLVTATLLSLLGVQCLGAAEPEAGRKLALLVGCTEYADLPGRKQLKGPANDVVMLRTMLVNQFHFAPENVRVLANQAHVSLAELAQQVEPAIICEDPTDEQITAEFERLISLAQPGDHIFLLLSGHGSRQPDTDHDPIGDYEPDGLDEVFLPCNIVVPEGGQEAVEHAITDDQIRGWLAKMVEQGAFVFLVADSCHSSSVARGEVDVDGEDNRRNVGAQELGIPEAALEAAWERASEQRQQQGPAKPDWFEAAATTAGSSGVVALYAAQPHEEAEEYYPLKPPGPKFGRLSHMLHEVLSQCGQRITYQELAQRILWRFEQNNWIKDSTPEIEGTALDRAVLDLQSWPGRSKLTLHRSKQGDSLTAGSLHGITAGSILAVYPPVKKEGDQQLLGYVCVRQVYPLSSDVDPVAWQDVPVNSQLPDEGRCELAFREQYSELLRLSVESDVRGDGAVALRAQAIQVLETADSYDDARFHVVTEGPSDWTAVIVDSGVYLQRTGTPRVDWSDAEQLDEARRRGDVFGAPFPLDAQVGDKLAAYLQGIAKADALRRLAEEAASRDPVIDVTLELVQDGGVLSAGESMPTLKSNDFVQIKITNTGAAPAAVLVFYIDANFGIELRTRDQPVIPIGGELTIDFEITDSTLGPEHVIVIAVRAKDKGVISELSQLRQTSLLASRSRGADSPFQTPLGRLLDTSLTGTRGGPQADAAPAPGGYAIRRFTWNVIRTPDPSP